jgi:hypothetical protein
VPFVLSEIGCRLEIRHQTAGEPNQLDVALARRMSQVPACRDGAENDSGGCSVIVAATVCGLISSEIVNSNTQEREITSYVWVHPDEER